MNRGRLSSGAKAIAILACVAAAAASRAGVNASGASAQPAILLPSCTNLPDKTCYGDRVNVYKNTDAGPDPACTTCLQGSACCDAVGRCDEDQACIASFQATHACVIDGGPVEESRCKGALTTDTSKALYDCMRSNCGRTCGIPDCTLDKTVGLFDDPACDLCIGTSCCKPINDCYGDRRCKLVVECISAHCPNTLGPSLTTFGAAPPAVIEAARVAACAARDPSVSAGPCIQRCLDDFAPAGDAGTTDDQAARCLAFDVYACGASAKCGPSCVRPDAGRYASDGPWPEDQLDASR